MYRAYTLVKLGSEYIALGYKVINKLPKPELLGMIIPASNGRYLKVVTA